MPGDDQIYAAVAALVLRDGATALLDFAQRLERGELELSSSSSKLQRELHLPAPRIQLYRDILARALSTDSLASVLRASSVTAARMEKAKPKVEVAWTFPGTATSHIRTTGGVAREIISDSQATLLLVGYAVTVDAALSGLAAQTIDALARASERGVAITAVLHRQANRDALLSAWKQGVPLPAFFTWPEGRDSKASIHAKLLVADRKDALVTSANLTYHGFERNLEMGVRVQGPPAAQIAEGIQSLIRAGHLVRWS